VKGEGYFINNVAESKRHQQEAAVLTCKHCGKVLLLHDVPGQVNWREDGGWCRSCDGPLCGGKDNCADRYVRVGCESIVRRIEQFATAAVKLEQFRKLAGLESPVPARSLILPGA
jgi:hypothetical protein